MLKLTSRIFHEIRGQSWSENEWSLSNLGLEFGPGSKWSGHGWESLHKVWSLTDDCLVKVMGVVGYPQRLSHMKNQNLLC